MKVRKGLALILALALGLTWCLADVEESDSDLGLADVVENLNGDSAFLDVDSGEDEGISANEPFPEDEGISYNGLFPDVPNDADYVDAVTYLAGEGIITGDPLGNFNPDAEITRAEVAAMICRLMGAGDEAQVARNQIYGDVSGHWAEGYITTATRLGVFNGDGAGNFRPNDNVTYEQIIKILVCVGGHDSEARSKGGWPNGYIAVAAELGITNGVQFSQTANAPRSAVAQLIYNAI